MPSMGSVASRCARRALGLTARPGAVPSPSARPRSSWNRRVRPGGGVPRAFSFRPVGDSAGKLCVGWRRASGRARISSTARKEQAARARRQMSNFDVVRASRRPWPGAGPVGGRDGRPAPEAREARRRRGRQLGRATETPSAPLTFGDCKARRVDAQRAGKAVRLGARRAAGRAKACRGAWRPASRPPARADCEACRGRHRRDGDRPRGVKGIGSHESAVVPKSELCGRRLPARAAPVRLPRDTLEIETGGEGAASHVTSDDSCAARGGRDSRLGKPRKRRPSHACGESKGNRPGSRRARRRRAMRSCAHSALRDGSGSTASREGRPRWNRDARQLPIRGKTDPPERCGAAANVQLDCRERRGARELGVRDARARVVPSYAPPFTPGGRYFVPSCLPAHAAASPARGRRGDRTAEASRTRRGQRCGLFLAQLCEPPGALRPARADFPPALARRRGCRPSSERPRPRRPRARPLPSFPSRSPFFHLLCHHRAARRGSGAALRLARRRSERRVGRDPRSTQTRACKPRRANVARRAPGRSGDASRTSRSPRAHRRRSGGPGGAPRGRAIEPRCRQRREISTLQSLCEAMRANAAEPPGFGRYGRGGGRRGDDSDLRAGRSARRRCPCVAPRAR